MTAAATAALDGVPADAAGIALVCDGDLGESAGALAALVDAVQQAGAAISRSPRSAAGSVAASASRCASLAGRSAAAAATSAGAPISGQRAMRLEVLRAVLPFASGYGMEVGMTVDAVAPATASQEVELDLEHRATGRTLGGFVHRGAQLRDFARAWLARR